MELLSRVSPYQSAFASQYTTIEAPTQKGLHQAESKTAYREKKHHLLSGHVNMSQENSEKRLKFVIVGGGPGSLSVAIELAQKPWIDWNLYEKRPRLSEIGRGFTLQPQTWRLLERNGAADNIGIEDYYRSAEGLVEQRRRVLHHLKRLLPKPVLTSNGRTGELLSQKQNPRDLLPKHQSGLLARARRQSALLKKVDLTRVHLSTRLVGVELLLDNRIRISLEDGAMDEVDVGEDLSSTCTFQPPWAMSFSPRTLPVLKSCWSRNLGATRDMPTGMPFAPTNAGTLMMGI